MNTASSTQSPSTRQKATVVREYGPFPVEGVHGVTHDGTHVWFAHGKKIAAMNPEDGRDREGNRRSPPRLAPRSMAASTCIKSARTRSGRWIRKDRPRGRHAPGARYDQRQFGPRLGRWDALGRAVQGARHPSDRRDDREGEKDAAIRSFRDRAVSFCRRRPVARRLGRRHDGATRLTTPATKARFPCSRRSRCPPACRASRRRGTSCSAAAESRRPSCGP